MAVTATQLEKSLEDLQSFAADTWSNLAMVERIKAFRADFRDYLKTEAGAGKPPERVVVSSNTQWG